MNIGIVGSRTFKNYKYLDEIVSKIINDIDTPITIVSGGAKGADLLGKQYAEINNLGYLEFKPDWNKYKRAAGFIRNTTIVDNSDIVIAFRVNKSNGTKDTIDKAIKKNKKVYVYEITNVNGVCKRSLISRRIYN